MPRRSPERAREDLHAQLLARRPELEEALLTRVLSLPGPRIEDPEYTEGLRQAVGLALDHGLEAIERGEKQAPPIPPQLLAQVRLAARSGVSLDAVFRRCVAGHALLSDFVIEEADAVGLRGKALQRLLGTQAACLDRLLAALAEEHARELESNHASEALQHSERIERLLSAEPLDTSPIAYDFEGHHLGAIAKGPGAKEALFALAGSMGCRLLLVEREEGVIWAWLGSREEIDAKISITSRSLPLALGEPARGQSGWRLSHRQARAALPIALRRQSPVRYAEVALLASNLQDELLTTSLRQLYLLPLRQERDGGKRARETLRAYLAAGRSISSAAALLGVSRRTVANRLGAIEARIGSPLRDCLAGVEAALALHDLGRPGGAPKCGG